MVLLLTVNCKRIPVWFIIFSRVPDSICNIAISKQLPKWRNSGWGENPFGASLTRLKSYFLTDSNITCIIGIRIVSKLTQWVWAEHNPASNTIGNRRGRVAGRGGHSLGKGHLWLLFILLTHQIWLRKSRLLSRAQPEHRWRCLSKT